MELTSKTRKSAICVFVDTIILYKFLLLHVNHDLNFLNEYKISWGFIFAGLISRSLFTIAKNAKLKTREIINNYQWGKFSL